MLVETLDALSKSARAELEAPSSAQHLEDALVQAAGAGRLLEEIIGRGLPIEAPLLLELEALTRATAALTPLVADLDSLDDAQKRDLRMRSLGASVALHHGLLRAYQAEGVSA